MTSAFIPNNKTPQAFALAVREQQQRDEQAKEARRQRWIVAGRWLDRWMPDEVVDEIGYGAAFRLALGDRDQARALVEDYRQRQASGLV